MLENEKNGAARALTDRRRLEGLPTKGDLSHFCNKRAVLEQHPKDAHLWGRDAAGDKYPAKAFLEPIAGGNGLCESLAEDGPTFWTISGKPSSTCIVRQWSQGHRPSLLEEYATIGSTPLAVQSL